MILYIIRHADPDYQNDTITELGHKQAKALSEKMKIRGVNRVFSSPQGRALATMKYTTDSLGLEYEIKEWAREVWPEMFIQKKTKWGDNMASFDYPGEFYFGSDFSDDLTKWSDDKLFDGTDAKERYQFIQEQSDQFFEELGYKREKNAKSSNMYKCIKPNNEKIAMFCHAGFGSTWLSQLLNIPTPLVWSGMFMFPSSVTTILFEQRSDEWAVPRMIELSDVSHLRDNDIEISRVGLYDKSGQKMKY